MAFFLWCYVCFVLLRFRLYDFVEAAALCSIVLRYAGVPIATHVSFFFFFFFFFLFIWRCRFFRVFFPVSLCMESTSYVLSFRMVLSYLVTTGWIFDISLCENSSNQSINHERSQAIREKTVGPEHRDVSQSLNKTLVFPYGCQHNVDNLFVENSSTS